MRKLYTDVSLETPFMVSYNDTQLQACANDEDTVTIGATEFIRLTDENGHNVSDREGNQLLLNDGVVYKVVSGVPESTNVQVTDVITPTQYTLTINPTPADATVTLTAAGFTQVGNSITVDDGTTVSYSVSKTGYVTSTGTYTINGANYTLSVTLEEEQQPTETIWHLTAPTSQVIIDESDFSSMTTSFAFMPLWNESAATEGTTEWQNELRATSDAVSPDEYQVYVNTEEMGVIDTQDQTTGETMSVTPLVAIDGNGYHKVAYDADSVMRGDILYLRLANGRADDYSYNLYYSNDGEYFQEAINNNTSEPIHVNVVPLELGGQ